MPILPMRAEHLDFAAALVQQEGWYSQTREVFEDFLAYDPGGCFVAVDGGAVAGAAAAVGVCVGVRYQRTGFIGELIVVPEQRGRGTGTALFHHALAYASRGMDLVALDADAPGVPIYQKAGFEVRTRSLRFYGHVPGRQHPCVRPMTGDDLPYVIRLDLGLFGDDRGFFLCRRFERCPELCFVLEGKTGLNGYIMGSPGVGLLTVGPWAVQPGIADPGALLEHLACFTGGQKLRIGVLETRTEAVAWLRRCPGLAEGEPSLRMVLDQPPNPVYGTRPLGMPAGPGDRPGTWAIGSPAKG